MEKVLIMENGSFLDITSESIHIISVFAEQIH